MTADQHEIIEEIKGLSLDAQTPLQKIEHTLHPYVAFLIMPLFALANAGMHIGSTFFSELMNPVSAGVGVGLVLGKSIGVFGFTYVMVRLKLADLPALVNWKHVTGVALLAGVGFTMSLFVSNLAFSDAEHVDAAKYGILLASLLSGTAGITYLRSLAKGQKDSIPSF
ncbi:Na+/H+ antiporter NhaA [Siphonobacter sp. BAB-5385]|uniref:Na+/H+ antiporter NhaA n=1 Tax=Siphonobacter sp. BAB-5385 TaxID=1864822 RepID=UPI0020CF69DE|nr:Na+/H+ antiporter NhaA [Siphonobacter sp. BAB-5385]